MKNKNRKMTPEEEKQLQELYDSMVKSIDDQIRQRLINGMWGQSPVSSAYAAQASPNTYSYPPITSRHHNPYRGVSPTDVDAKGMYSYQEPERDEQGTFYGYKILVRNNNDCPCPECSALRSPRYPAVWMNGELTSDREPEEKTMYGIHFTKRPDHPELEYYRVIGDRKSVFVKCALSGTIVETEQGFRAQHAQIIGVYCNGHWTSYQDYQERTRPDPRRITYEEMEWARRRWEW